MMTNALNILCNLTFHCAFFQFTNSASSVLQELHHILDIKFVHVLGKLYLAVFKCLTSKLITC